ncbi:hypothetical protein FRC07_008287 [Ceratobasidium sp. 392]|nr:hypothetical protein FRC07_008287 [Ceratobasidium sp. 392]
MTPNMQRTLATLFALGVIGIILFTMIVLVEMLVFAFIPVTHSWFLAPLITWGICVTMFVAIGVFGTWLILELRRGVHGSYSKDFESRRPLSSRLLSALTPLYLQQGLTSDREEPAYLTRVEVLNLPSLRGDLLAQSASVAVDVLAQSPLNDHTFATTPFASPPVFTMQILVTEEQTVVVEEASSTTPNRMDFVSVGVDRETKCEHHATA